MKNKIYSIVFLIFSTFLSYSQNPEIIKDIFPGIGTSGPWHLMLMTDEIYFLANDGVNGSELWRTDATEIGTYMVKNIGEGINDLCESTTGCGEEFIVMNNVLYFKASDPLHGAELWRSDGTEAGTYLVKDINSGTGDCTNYYMNGQYFAILNDVLYFAANGGGDNVELWRSDGTEAGTYLVNDFAAGTSSFPKYITSIDGSIYFGCVNAVGNAELWKSDGTEAGSVLLKQIGTYSPEFKNMFIKFGDYIYFAGGDDVDNIYNFELWRTNGTSVGTELFIDLNGDEEFGSTPHQFHILNNKLLFSVDNSHNLYISDGTILGTAKLSDQSENEFDATYEAYLLAESKFYFQATNADNELGLWVTDGTNDGTKFLSAIESGKFSDYHDFNHYYSTVVNGNNIIYRGYDDILGCTAIFQSDGTPAGTFQTLACEELANAQSMITFNEKVIISGVVNSYGGELWLFEPEFTTGIQDVSENKQIHIYPNSAVDFITIAHNNLIQNEKIFVTNNLGKIIYSSILLPVTHTINIKDFGTGIYFVTINKSVQKFIKQ